MKEKKLPWWSYAIMLGTVFFLCLAIIKPIGVSTQFSVASGMMHEVVDPSVITENPEAQYGYKSSNAYYDAKGGKLAQAIVEPWRYDFVFDIGIILGGFLAFVATRRRTRSERLSPPTVTEERNPKELMLAFLGGILLLYGARLADGCTSGHMMSGITQSSVSGLIFAAAVFSTALIVARFR